MTINVQDNFFLFLGFTRLTVSENIMKSWLRDSCADAYGRLYASKVKAVFARLVRDAISFMNWDR